MPDEDSKHFDTPSFKNDQMTLRTRILRFGYSPMVPSRSDLFLSLSSGSMSKSCRYQCLSTNNQSLQALPTEHKTNCVNFIKVQNLALLTNVAGLVHSFQTVSLGSVSLALLNGLIMKRSPPSHPKTLLDKPRTRKLGASQIS
eukprot:661174-Amphidinium_carterae.1